MRITVCLLFVAAGAFVGSGCGMHSLADYYPIAPGSSFLYSLCVALPGHYVCLETASDHQMSEPETIDDITRMIGEEVARRPARTDFRCLCALINTYFGSWDRLVIIERIGFAGPRYGYVVIAVTPNGLRAVTNLSTVNGDAMNWGLGHMRSLKVDNRRLAGPLAEAENARTVLPEGLFWFEAVDWPLYVLHDVRSDGSTFSFGVCGYGAREGEETSVSRVPNSSLGFAKAAELIKKGPSWEAVPYGSARGRELQLAGRVYAALVASLWESAMGTGDYYILGKEGVAE